MDGIRQNNIVGYMKIQWTSLAYRCMRRHRKLRKQKLKFHENIDRILTQRHNVHPDMDDLNSKVGQGRVDHVVGPFGLEERNDRGDRFDEWCLEKEHVVVNT